MEKVLLELLLSYSPVLVLIFLIIKLYIKLDRYLVQHEKAHARLEKLLYVFCEKFPQEGTKILKNGGDE